MDKKLLIPLVFTLLLILAADAFNYRNIVSSEVSQAAVAETLEVSRALTTLVSLMQDAETGQRGFLLTGEEQYLTPYNNALAELGPALSRLTSLASGNEERLGRVDSLRAAIDAKLDELEETVRARRQLGLEAAQRIVTTDRGKQEMDAIRAIVAAMETAQNRRLERGVAAADSTRRLTRAFAIGSVFAGILILTLLGFMWTREANRRANAAATIAEQHELLHVTLHSIGDGLVTTDQGGRIDSMNPVAESLTGWRLDNAQGRQIEDIFVIVNENSRQPVPNPVTRCLTQGQTVELANHTMLIAKDGSERPIADSAAPIHDAHGKVIGAVLIFRDVTERKKLEDSLRQQAAELSEATRQKDEFLAILAHELRNPLAPIANAVTLAERAEDRLAIDQALAIMRRQVQQLSRLVDDLLHIGRINTGRMELRLEVVAIGPIVQHAAEIVQPVVDRRDQRLVVAAIEPDLTVYGDSARLTQIIGNLLDNASKYSANETRISLDVVQEDGEMILSVRDQGIGIKENELPRVFDMFSQLDSGGMNEGLGIGLALVKRLVELHGGTIEARSAGPDLGSEFVFRMPTAKYAQKPSPIDPKVPAAPRKIVVVDDNADAADTLAVLLRSNGHAVQTANSGREAIRIAEAAQPDIMFLDIGMPGMNGYEVCREIRGTEWGRDIPIVALTGWDQDRTRTKGIEAGFAGHLVKPVHYDKINQTLRDMLDGRSAG